MPTEMVVSTWHPILFHRRRSKWLCHHVSWDSWVHYHLMNKISDSQIKWFTTQIHLIFFNSKDSLTFHKQQSIRTTSVQDLDPRSFTNNVHVSVLVHEMSVIEPAENPSRALTLKPLVFLIHIKSRTNDDHFPVSQWQSFFYSSLGVPTYPLRLSLDLFNSVHTSLFLMILLGIICRLAKIYQRLHRFMIGLFINWGTFWFRGSQD